MPNSFPQVFKLRQQFHAPRVEDVDAEVRAQLQRLSLEQKVRPGQSVAITAGSRGITNIAEIIRSIVAHLRQIGAQPVIVPAMGSHGGATAEGQRRVIESYGITEEYCGCPIQASMETVVIGQAPEGFDIHFDRHAYQADHVLVCARVKPHTGFKGKVQSGLLKMMLIGLGKREGATVYHQATVDFGFDEIVDSMVDTLIERGKVVAGLAIVENGYDETARIEAIAPQDFVARDTELLELACQLMPRLPFPEADVLLVDEIGKNISGTGMDTNLVGRKWYDHQAADHESPKIRRIVVRGLTPATHGNALGIGMAEFCLQRVVDGIDHQKMAVNGVTSTHVSAAMIPLAYGTDRDVLAAATATIGLRAPRDARLMWIRNTLKVGELACSAVYWDQAQSREDLTILSDPQPLPIGDDGFLPDFVDEVMW